MNREEIKQRLIDMLQELFPEAGIDKDMLEYVDLIDDLGMESITFVSVVVEVEDLFGITIPDDVLLLDYFRNVNGILKIIEDIKNKERQVTEGV